MELALQMELPIDHSGEVAELVGAKKRIAEALLDAGDYGLSNVDLSHPSIGGLRFGARIFELKPWLAGHGYFIEVSHPNLDRPGLFFYHLRKTEAR